LFCAVTQRPMRRTLDWDPFFAIARDEDRPWREKLNAYAAIAHDRFQTEAFEAFCDEHLGELDEVAFEFFASADAEDAIRRKVAALYPAHEVDAFTHLFFQRVQHGRTPPSPRTRAPQ
jgi:hypothetical protein